MVMSLMIKDMPNVGLNQVSLASLIMTLGMLVDNAIVVSDVGYGDFTPTNDLNRLFTAIYIVVGVSVRVRSFGHNWI